MMRSAPNPVAAPPSEIALRPPPSLVDREHEVRLPVLPVSLGAEPVAKEASDKPLAAGRLYRWGNPNPTGLMNRRLACLKAVVRDLPMESSDQRSRRMTR